MHNNCIFILLIINIITTVLTILFTDVVFKRILGRRFYDDNENDNENDNEILYTKTHRFNFVVYYHDDEYEPRKNTRNDDDSTQKFRCRTRCRCRSEILTHLLNLICNRCVKKYVPFRRHTMLFNFKFC